MSRPSIDDELSKIDEMSESSPVQAIQQEGTNQTFVVGIDRALWGTWWIGTILIVLSWFSIVSTTIGWIGFAAALSSTFVSVLVRKYWRVPR